MFGLPQPPSETLAIHTIDVTDPPRALEVILRLIYPSADMPVVKDLTLLSEVLIVADKYDIAVAQSRFRKSLEGVAKTEPLRVYAIACQFGYENEMKVASSYTTSIHLPDLDELPDEFKSISATEYHRLIRLHKKYRKAVVAATFDSPALEVPMRIDFRRVVSAAIEGLPLDLDPTKVLTSDNDKFGIFPGNERFIRVISDHASALNPTV